MLVAHIRRFAWPIAARSARSPSPSLPALACSRRSAPLPFRQGHRPPPLRRLLLPPLAAHRPGAHHKGRDSGDGGSMPFMSTPALAFRSHSACVSNEPRSRARIKSARPHRPTAAKRRSPESDRAWAPPRIDEHARWWGRGGRRSRVVPSVGQAQAQAPPALRGGRRRGRERRDL
ncbi:hypothetical protein ZWY2020_020771 [Hordeum vulgare]|nr:hypothetical protein ZWY2020_020771 [Hordeum vulgare]